METLPNKSAFSANLSSIFLAKPQGGDASELTLIELKEGSLNPHIEQFSLLFKGSNQIVLPQQIYQMKHPLLGDFDLFLVPIRNDGHGSYYEAVFNRLIDT